LWCLSRKVYVLRIGHRPVRDHRVTTHVGLVARALGADGIILEETVEESIIKSLERVVETWGGQFSILRTRNPRETVVDWKKRGGIVVHLTMYGENISEELLNYILSQNGDILIVVGGEKVPSWLYTHADYNVAIGNQPHSEVAALAIFLDRLFRGRELLREFPGAKIVVIPSKRGKRVVRRNESK
jgi:tRNA (cytidine56-2'-O)-methyltransferase